MHPLLLWAPRHNKRTMMMSLSLDTQRTLSIKSIAAIKNQEQHLPFAYKREVRLTYEQFNCRATGWSEETSLESCTCVHSHRSRACTMNVADVVAEEVAAVRDEWFKHACISPSFFSSQSVCQAAVTPAAATTVHILSSSSLKWWDTLAIPCCKYSMAMGTSVADERDTTQQRVDDNAAETVAKQLLG